MNFTSKCFATLASGLIGLSFAADTACAVPITGKLALKGMFELNGGLGDATAFTSFTNVSVTSGTGDYANVPVGTPVSYAPQPGDSDGGFSFNPLDPSPLSPLWIFSLDPGPTTYSFDLDSVTILFQSDFVLALTGTGTAKIDGFSDTAGTWNFTSTNFGPTLFEFNNSATVPVPEGGSMIAIFGFSLFGVEALRRKLSSAAHT